MDIYLRNNLNIKYVYIVQFMLFPRETGMVLRNKILINVWLDILQKLTSWTNEM